MIETRLKLPMAKQPLSIKLQEEAQQDGHKIKFVNPNTDNYEDNLRSCAARKLPMAPRDFHKGEKAVVCGSGPSLRDHEVLERIRAEQEDGAVIYACKAAIKHLADNGIKPDYGVSMDPGAHIADPRKIAKVPGVVHIIASTSDPEVFDYLLGSEHGEPATVWVFHSATGFQKEITDDEWEALPDEERRLYLKHEDASGVRWFMTEQVIYEQWFDDPACMTGGFNVVNRTVSLAQYMGAKKVILAGADSGWRDGIDMYCDGPQHRPGVDMKDHGRVDGQNWNTRPDMLASAVALAKVAQREGPDKFEIIGDTLPRSLQGKDAEFLDQVAKFN